MSAKTVIAFALHLAAAAVMTWGYNHLDTTFMHQFIVKQKGGHLQYLTIQALAITWITMVLSLLSDVLGSQYVRNAKRAFFMIALPLSVVVTSVYWSLMTFAPHLILLRAPEPSAPSFAFSDAPDGLVRIPIELDLALHATPALSLLIDFFLFEKSYGEKAAKIGATGMAGLFGVWYSCWVEYCATFNGTFPYPFLTVSPLPIRIVIYSVVTAIAFLSFRAINAVHKAVWGTKRAVKVE